ncbi:MAG TPA: PEP/pyruvate-binding domain-containing protein [Ilumatobacteraceae bacterium]|nr:PEP/pyruvate-binding domain-containing protein [Ilumatobacteraceae bacterium]
MSALPSVVVLDDPRAVDPALVGAKAANLARARSAGLPALPGVVLTTSWSPAAADAATDAWRDLSDGGARRVVVRSSSTGEDGGESSMAGVFESVLDVGDEARFLAAVDAVVGSAAAAREAGLVDAAMAVLVQPMIDAEWGGVLFGADPVSGRRDRFLIAAVDGGPDALVSGRVDGWTAVLDRRGRVREVRSGHDAARPPHRHLRRLATLARQVARTYGGPQDIEWAVTADGHLHLLQARPITTIGPATGTVFGPGPVAESFPAPLATLEQDLWLSPMRDGLRAAIRLTGSMPARALERSPIVVVVDGMAAADLTALGVDPVGGGVLRRLDPRPPARRLRAAWRVGRLRSAFVALATDLVGRVDTDLSAVPALDDLSNHELVAILRNGRRTLASLHGHEAIAGLLIPSSATASVTGASLALSAVAQAHAEGVPMAELIERDPVVLALLAPSIGDRNGIDELGMVAAPFAPPALRDDPDPAAVAREALRLRVRWLQELTARAAWELAHRLVAVEVLPSLGSARLLTLDELAHAAQLRTVPADLDARREPTGRSLPARFRLDDDGTAWAAAPPSSRRRRRASAHDGVVGVSTGTARGSVVVLRDQTGHEQLHRDVPVGAVLVVSHLDPRLAPVISRLGALVAETGSALSHLAILAREYRVPAVVGVAGATTRFHDGQCVSVDGSAGTVTVDTVDEYVETPSRQPITVGALS